MYLEIPYMTEVIRTETDQNSPIRQTEVKLVPDIGVLPSQQASLVLPGGLDPR